MRLALLAMSLVLSTGLFAQKAPDDHKIQVLTITGQDAHPWRQASPFLRGILNETGKFEVRVTEEFRGSSLETVVPYDVVVLVYSDENLNIQKWSQSTRDALTTYVSSGRAWLLITTPRRHPRIGGNTRSWCDAFGAPAKATILRCTTTGWISAIPTIRSRAG